VTSETPPGADRVTPGVEARESPIEGLGVFATRDFKSGERISVVNVVREITDAAPLRPEAGERLEHCARPDGKLLLYGPPDRHLNHSCNPNAWERHSEDRIEIVARRPIARGDEVRVDYLINNSGGDSWPCNCGTPRCRGLTGFSFFTLPVELQREYLPLLATWFIARHQSEVRRLDES
jgi:hypothetical protein